MSEFAQALIAEENADTENALAGYRRALDADPVYTELALKIAYELARRNDVPGAIQVLKDAIKAAPKDPSPLVFLSQIYSKHLRKPDLARKYAEQALALSPDHIPAYAAMVEVSTEAGQLKKAEQFLDRGARSTSRDPSYWLQLGEIQTRLWLKEDGVSTPENLQKMNAVHRKAAELGGDRETQSKVADFFVLSRQLRDAVPFYRAALSERSAPSDAATLGLREKLARALLASGSKEEGVALLENVTLESPMRMETVELLAELYEADGQLEKAVQKYEHTLQIDSSQPRGFLRLAEACIRAKQADKAVNTMREARRRFPDRPELALSLGITLSQAKQHEDALNAFAQAQSEAEANHEELLNAQFFFQYGAAAEQAARIDKAAELLRRSIELDPANAAQARNYLGYMWADRGLHLEEATSLVEKALESDPDNGAFLDSLGWCLFKKGDHERALRELLRATGLIKPEDPVVHEHLGDTYEALGKSREALQHWEKSLSLDPENTTVSEKVRKAKGANAAAANRTGPEASRPQSK